MLRQTKTQIAMILREIYLGDEWRDSGESCERNEPSGNAETDFWPGLSKVHSDEGGKITLVTTITMMFFLLLVCYIGNVGMSVRQKMEMQNAADSAAYSIALTQARGMNAMTVSNHMMGESTAIVVMLESLGGKIQTEFGKNYNSSESRYYNGLIDSLKVTAPMLPPLRTVDAKIVEFVAKILTRDKGKHNSGATIYDAKLTLKYVFSMTLVVKTACTIGAAIGRVFPPLVFLEIVFSVIDIGMTAGPVLKVAQEFVFLEALEAVSLIMVPFHRTVETVLIPAVGIYGATVAGQSPLTPPGPLGSGENVVNRSAEKTLDDLSKFYKQQKIELAMVPVVNKLTLPVEAEKPPTKKGASGSNRQGRWEMPPSQWEGPFFTNPVLKTITDALDKVTSVTGTATRVIGWLLDAVKWIPGLNEGPVKDAADKIQEINRVLSLDIKSPDYRNGYPENPSHYRNSKYRLPEFYWQAERKSQWVRATYPYVESYREPMIYWMQKGFSVFDLELSNAATYYTHWTNRYTLAKAWQIRSGETMTPGLFTPKMFIMKSSTPEKKGYENWVSDDSKAEEMFVVYGVAFRPESKSHFASNLFPKSKNDGAVALAAAMIYNANSRNVPQQGSGGSGTQLDNGWDTLNWLPTVKAHEWGGQTPSNSNGGSPWKVLGGKLKANRGAQVKINWQAKLVPITLDGGPPKKLRSSINGAGSKLKEDIKKQVKKALEQSSLIKH